MRNNKIWILWSIAVVFGMLFSIGDYRVWKKAETEKYGQGWVGQERVVEIAPLIGPYINKTWGVRIKYPKDWTFKENIDYSETNIYKKPLPMPNRRVTIIEFSNSIKSMSINVFGEIIPKKDLVDIVTNEAVDISGDREYKNTERAKFTVIRWESPFEVKYKAYAKKFKVTYIIEAKSGPKEASLLQKTLMSVLEAFVVI